MNIRQFLKTLCLLPLTVGCVHWPGIDNRKPKWTQIKFSEVKVNEKFNGNPSGPYAIKLDSGQYKLIDWAPVYNSNGIDWNVYVLR